MRLGLRRNNPPPDEYGGCRLVRMHGCYFGVPEFLDLDGLQRRGQLRYHPAVLKATTLPALQGLIDRAGGAFRRPTAAGRCEGYDVVRSGAAFYAVPQGAGPVDLDLEEDRRRAGVVCGESAEELAREIRALRESVPVEFAGWLPIYETMGNCGRHPQFAHTATPPPGYRFTRSIPAEEGDPPRRGALSWLHRGVGGFFRGLGWLCDRARGACRSLGAAIRPLVTPFRYGARVPLRARLRLLGAIVRLFFVLRRGGGRLRHVLRFLRSRNYPSQVLVAGPRRLVFLTSTPFTYNQDPWIVEIEDASSLFYPFVHDGGETDYEVADSPYFPIVRALLESDQCRAVLTHMRSTARLLPTLFRSAAVARKVRYVPLGVKAPRRWQRHDEDDPEHINLLYINSWSQHPGNFQVRGGLDVLEAFSILHERYPQLRLTLRTSMMPLDEHYHRIMESGWVRVINRVLPTEEMEALHAESHVFLLPAARVHIVSLLQAMASGLAVVASDGWGFEEYLTHERNGLIVKGRYGKTSWVDEDAGILRQDYEPTFSPDAEVVRGLVEAVSRLVEDHELRRRLGRTARHDVERTYSLANWNRGLKEVFDAALAG
jgi:glycosyltransferase involved in cell wall biosynthesis